MKYINFQKEKEDLDLQKNIKGKTSSYTKDKIYFNIQRDINKYNFKSPRYKNIILNNILSIKENNNNTLNKNINIFKNNSKKSKDNDNNLGKFTPKVYNSFEFKSNRNRPLNSLEKIINKDLIESKVKTPKIQENLINQRYKIQSENNNIFNFKYIDGKIFGKNYKEEGDLIDYYRKKKLYLDNDRNIKELIITTFKELKDKLKIKEKNIIELNNKIKEYERIKK